MIRVLEVDFRLILKKWKVFILYGFIVGAMLHMVMQFKDVTGDEIFEIFNAITVFFLIMNFIFMKGELFEKKIIRYYIENGNRIQILLTFYIEAILMYLSLVSVIITILSFFKYYVSFENILLYLLIYTLYVVITMNVILHFNRIGNCIIIAFVLFWILPNIVNTLCVEYNFYNLQIFYYLSNETFIKTVIDMKRIIVSIIYIIFFLGISLIYFDKMEV